MYRAKNRRVMVTLSGKELAEKLLLQDREPGPEANRFTINYFKPERARAAWAKFGPQIMREWLKEKPHTRPHAFFLFSCQAKPPFPLVEDWPAAWAAFPENIPSEKVQKAFLDSLK